MGLPKKSGSAAADPTRLKSTARQRLLRAWEIGKIGFPVLFSICIASRIPPFFMRFLYVLVWPDAADEPGMLNVIAAVLVLLYDLASIFFGVLALLYAVAEFGSGRRVTVVGAFQAAFLRAKAGLATAAWWGGIVGVGLLCLVVPGLIFMTQYAFAGFALVDKGLSGRDALLHSKKIMKSIAKAVAINLFLLVVICFGVIVVVQGPLGLLLGFTFGVFALPDDSLFIAVFFGLLRLIAAQTVPIAGAVCLWALYEDIVVIDNDSEEPELIAL